MKYLTKYILSIYFIISYVNGDNKKQQQQQQTNNKPANNQVQPPPPAVNYYSYLRCWRCDYDDPEQCVKNFDFTKHKHEACDGKCLKAFEKVEARTKVEIDKAQLTPTIRKCVSQKEISSLQSLGINTKNGCHDIRTAKRRHKLYCFCENDLCNYSNTRYFFNLNSLFLIYIFFYFITKSIILNY